MKLIYTIGHSVHSLEEFLSLLNAHAIKKVIDVRTIPKSRYCPQFGQDKLRASLKRAKIQYRHMKDLGGLRRPVKDSINSGWINASFRGFADYMQTSCFQEALEKLETMALKKRCVLMCAEAVPWRCHRSLIADALTAKKWKVLHIQSRKTARLHKPTPFLKIKRGKLLYPSS